MKIKRGVKLENKPDMTPMIDMIFLLIIFFMVSTTLITYKVMNIHLPKSSTAERTPGSEELVIDVKNNNSVIFEEKNVPINSIEKILDSYLLEHPDVKTVVIRGDRKIYYETLITIMDKIRKTGIENIQLLTEVQSSEPSSSSSDEERLD